MSHVRNSTLFTIRQTAKASGLSRAMILKLEKAGFLTPTEVNAETGYRYYDSLSVSKLQQYQMMRRIAMPQQLIFDYYRRELEPDVILDYLTEHIRLMERFREEMNLRHDRGNHRRVSELILPACAAYCETDDVDSVADSYVFALNVHHAAIERGLALSDHELPFTERFDTRIAGRGGPASPYRLKVCLPVSPEHIGEPGVERFPETRALCILYYGGFDEYNEMWRVLWDEFNRRGLTPAGPGRGIGVLFPYVEPGMRMDRLTARFAIPILD